MLFTPKHPRTSRGAIVLSGITDNAGNQMVVNKLTTSKFPLVVILGEVSEQLRSRAIELSLEWVKGTK